MDTVSINLCLRAMNGEIVFNMQARWGLECKYHSKLLKIFNYILKMLPWLEVDIGDIISEFISVSNAFVDNV